MFRAVAHKVHPVNQPVFVNLMTSVNSAWALLGQNGIQNQKSGDSKILPYCIMYLLNTKLQANFKCEITEISIFFKRAPEM